MCLGELGKAGRERPIVSADRAHLPAQQLTDGDAQRLSQGQQHPPRWASARTGLQLGEVGRGDVGLAGQLRLAHPLVSPIAPEALTQAVVGSVRHTERYLGITT